VVKQTFHLPVYLIIEVVMAIIYKNARLRLPNSIEPKNFLQMAESLKRINDLIDTFVYAAAHDLKAPVSNLKLITEVINSTPEEKSKLQLQKRYENIIKTLDNTISGLVNVLTLEKKEESIAKKVSFQDISNQIMLELDGWIREAEPEIHIDFSACPTITFMESYLLIIFRNILSNALKYRSRRRKLILNLQSDKTGKFIELSFSDNGIGINLDVYMKDLFKPFKRFSSLSEGSGLGLHLVNNIVTKNGGYIDVKSKSGKGTTFIIYLVEYKGTEI
jgi:two-component system, chemotaxis family, CheB/CheR fusion protein